MRNGVLGISFAILILTVYDATAPWLILIASVEEECEMLELGDTEANRELVCHSRMVVTVEVTMARTELSMPTGCLACIVRNIPLLVCV